MGFITQYGEYKEKETQTWKGVDMVGRNEGVLRESMYMNFNSFWHSHRNKGIRM
ncbi:MULTISPECIES: hypothetical protein [Bacillus]|uniref:hypothetical protein n=1 Tax=Bacillus TaxID=1386 RepID=UPI00061A5548|nr:MULTISPECIES: hypothetical protein [Bacillus]AKD30296.1 hypothetical protein AW02_021470 [Bacillus velezensis NJN-6]MBB4873871.1 hypothetical protein [Bacillus velezensis]MBE1279897.1 hypothetical protein [Bacillus sp. Bvel1]MBW8600397.1 hypothetical protein [Bacillus amyloliquefaciens]MEE3673357.1 hypothetical protein [Bacillus velezensis]